MSGKGSGRRPTQISEKEAEDNWNRIFGNKKGYIPLEDHFNILLEDKDGFNDEKTEAGRNNQIQK